MKEVKADAPVGSVTVTGEFKGVSEITNRLSCYCTQGGFITMSNGKKVLVCFPDDAEVKECANMVVTGVYEDGNAGADVNNPCPSGAQTFLRVSEFHCE